MLIYAYSKILNGCVSREQDMEGFMKEIAIETLKVRVWHMLEYDHSEIEPQSQGDTYVIRWQYMIVNAGQY